jgi:hypothetical protein
MPEVTLESIAGQLEQLIAGTRDALEEYRDMRSDMAVLIAMMQRLDGSLQHVIGRLDGVSDKLDDRIDQLERRLEEREDGG